MALERKNGFSSLPDEILAVVLENAAYDCDVDNRDGPPYYNYRVTSSAPIRTVRAAIKLSHSCRRFRRLILNIPAFYNRICNSMPPDMVSTCCDRLTTTNVGMDVRLYNNSTEDMDFIRMAMKNSKHWHHYTHFYSSTWEIDEEFIADMEVLAKTVHKLDAPSLTSVSIHYPSSTTTHIQEGRRQDTFFYFKTWTMPNLSMLNLGNVIPSPFAGSASLRQLSLQWNPEEDNLVMFSLQTLDAFLAPCVLLEELAIELVCVSRLLSRVTSMGRLAKLDRLIRTNFTFRECDIHVVKTVMKELGFPSVQSMKLHILMPYDSLTVDPDMPEGDVHDILLEMFPDRTAFTKLSDLQLECDISRTYRPIQVSIPFVGLSKIKHLCLVTKNSILAPIPSGISLPSLRSLSFQYCRKLEVDWIASLLGVVKANGIFEPSHLEVKECRWTKYPVFTPSSWLSTITDEELANQYTDVTANDMRELML